MGGGKDSATVWALLSASPAELAWWFMEDDVGEYAANWRLEALRRTSGATAPTLTVCHQWRCPVWEACRLRRFDPCGHPWAALVAFAATLSALLQGFDAVAVGNERSASEGNGMVNGVLGVNHQFDKALQWELRAAAYIRQHVTSQIRYFSALSHLWEVQIMSRFAALPRDTFLPLILSCNEPIGGTRACAACSKCVFVGLLLAAFVPHPSAAWCIFGDDPLAREAALPIMAALLGREGTEKPLECVGTASEARLCLHRARRSYTAAGIPLPVCLRGPQADADAAAGAAMEAVLMTGAGQHAIPAWAQEACGAEAALFVGG